MIDGDMAHRAAPANQGVDPRLETLLETERRLEARIRAAEESARAQVEAARAAALRARERRAEEIDAAARAEEEAERKRVSEELRRIESAAAQATVKVRSMPEDAIERLARIAYDLVIRGTP